MNVRQKAGWLLLVVGLALVVTPVLTSAQGRTVRIPVDCAVPGGSEPDSMSDGKGVNHFTTCDDSNDF